MNSITGSPQLPRVGMAIAAGGSGSRYSATENKLFALLHGEPVIIHTLRNFVPYLDDGCCVIACAKSVQDDLEQWICRTLAPFQAKIRLVPGGKTRIESVRNAVAALPQTCELLAIHDAARPLADITLLAQLCNAAQRCNGGAVPGKTPRDTIKLCRKTVDDNTTTAMEMVIAENLPREALFAVETPQVFVASRYREILAALPDDADFTDDAGFFHAAGERVCCVENPRNNLKVTRPGDLNYL